MNNIEGDLEKPVVNFPSVWVSCWHCYRFHKIVIDIGGIYVHLCYSRSYLATRKKDLQIYNDFKDNTTTKQSANGKSPHKIWCEKRSLGDNLHFLRQIQSEQVALTAKTKIQVLSAEILP